jgi:hypothetical protein
MAGAAAATALQGAPIVPRDSVFMRSTSEVVRMFPPRLIFSFGARRHVAHWNQSWRP